MALEQRGVVRLSHVGPPHKDELVCNSGPLVIVHLTLWAHDRVTNRLSSRSAAARVAYDGFQTDGTTIDDDNKDWSERKWKKKNREKKTLGDWRVCRRQTDWLRQSRVYQLGSRRWRRRCHWWMMQREPRWRTQTRRHRALRSFTSVPRHVIVLQSYYVRIFFFFLILFTMRLVSNYSCRIFIALCPARFTSVTLEPWDVVRA